MILIDLHIDVFYLLLAWMDGYSAYACAVR